MGDHPSPFNDNPKGKEVGEDSHIKDQCGVSCNVAEGDSMETQGCIGPDRILV